MIDDDDFLGPDPDTRPAWLQRLDDIAKVVLIAVVGLGAPIAWAVSRAIQALRPFG